MYPLNEPSRPANKSNYHVPAPNAHVFDPKLLIMHLSELIALVVPGPICEEMYWTPTIIKISVIGMISSTSVLHDDGSSHNKSLSTHTSVMPKPHYH